MKIIFICFLSLIYGIADQGQASQNMGRKSSGPPSHGASSHSLIETKLIAESPDHRVKIYASAPNHFNPAFEISACYSHFENKYLLLHRSETVKNQPGVWGVPGGKVDSEETPKTAILREFFEETGIELNPQKLLFFKTVYIRDSKNDFVFHMFTYEFQEKPPVTLNLKEHQAFLWEPFEKAVLLPLLLGEVECFWILKDAQNVQRSNFP